MFFIGVIFGWLTAGVIYGAALWFHPWWWIGRVLRDAGFRVAVLVRPNKSVQVWSERRSGDGEGSRASRDS